jgi:hypothetical protein
VSRIHGRLHNIVSACMESMIDVCVPKLSPRLAPKPPPELKAGLSLYVLLEAPNNV